MTTDQLDLFQATKSRPVLSAAEEFRAELAAYRRTTKWKAKRKAKLNQTGRRCERCGSGIGRMEVHHKAYPERLGDERLEGLIVVCTACHEIEDERRAAEGKKRSKQALEDAIWNNGLNTFATNKYREDWAQGKCDYYDVAQEYAEWLEGRE